MTIKKNSAKCVTCGTEIESTYRHDFKVHFCDMHPIYKKEWKTIDGGEFLVDTDELTYNFAVDGGKAYIRRVGEGYTNTTEYEDEQSLGN